MTKRKAEKKEIDKLKFTLFRLFFKNIISKLLKRLGNDNSEYLEMEFGYSIEIKKRFE